MVLKDKLKELRIARGLTQEAVAEQLGVASQTVSKWERGLRSPDISLLPKIAVLYHCSIDSMFQMNTVWGKEHQQDFQSEIRKLREMRDFDGMYRAWLQEIELNPDQFVHYLDVMRFVIRMNFFDDEHITKMLSLAAYVETHCMDDDTRNDLYRIMVELCSHSENLTIKERAKTYYNKIPKLRHSREIYAKFVMDREEYRRQLKDNIRYMIDLTECSIRQLILPEMSPEEKIFYYRKAAALYEAVLDGQYGGVYDIALFCDYANLASLLMQIGKTEEAKIYMEKMLMGLEKHLSSMGRERKPELMDAVILPNSTSPEKSGVQLLRDVLINENLSVFREEIRDMLQRYEVKAGLGKESLNSL